jgi:hypothetical protein
LICLDPFSRAAGLAGLQIAWHGAISRSTPPENQAKFDAFGVNLEKKFADLRGEFPCVAGRHGRIGP